MSSILLVNQSEISYCEKQKFLDVYGVRLTPPFLEFNQAFEGKTYNKKLSIQNIGKSKVVVKMTPPTSYAFKIKPVKGYQLSPGLTLVRKVSYVYSYANSPSCIIPIYINENRYDYHLIATASSSEVNVTPKCIDFGSIDVGYTSPPHTLTLNNDGMRPVKFYINNFTCDDYTLIIEPYKGFLQANSTISVSLKLLANIEGIMQMELWVKADKPTMVLIQAEVIKPRFEHVSSSSLSTFTLIDFPVTYVGLTSTRSIYIRNSSASTSMFCIMGEVQHNIMSVDACREHEEDYLYFTGHPAFGMFQPRQVKAIHFNFHPQKPKRGHKLAPYYFCMFHICRTRAKFLTEDDYRELLNLDTASAVTYSRFSWSTSSTTQLQSEMDHSSLLASAASIVQAQYNVVRPSDDCTCVKYYLHAIPEIPNVTIIPDELTLSDLAPGRRETRVLQFQNLSKRLPIIVVYNKVAFIDVSETTIQIAPTGSIQISVFITPQNFGTVNSKMRFDLVYYDFPRGEHDTYKVIGKLKVPVRFNVKAVPKTPAPEINLGITPNYIKEVGKFCQDVRFEDNIEKPKGSILADWLVKGDNRVLMALPNDTQKSLRPWRNQHKCKTIFKRIPRYVPPLNLDYEMSVVEQQFKSKVNNYYTTYMRKLAERSKLAAPSNHQAIEYEVTTDRKLLCTDLKLPYPMKINTPEDNSLTQYLPFLIDPVQISNIIITPEVVHTGMMAAHHKYEFAINIKNNNNITIRVYARSDKSNVLFPMGHRMIIKGFSEADLLGTYISGAVGFYTAELKLIINDSAYIIIDIHANVCPIALKLDRNLIVFEGQQINHYVEVINTLSSDVVFKWKLACNNFSIEPDEGVVRSNRSLQCYLRHFPEIEGPSLADACITCSDKTVDQLRLFVKSDASKLFFHTNKLVLNNLPLNIPVRKTVLLHNESNSAQCYNYIPDEFIGIIDVFPKTAIVFPKSFCVLTLVLNMMDCVTFKAKLKFAILRSGFIDLCVCGNVVFPDVKIYPSIINFKKIPCSTRDVIRMSVENKSLARATVSFDLSMYSEYLITKTNQYSDITPVEMVTVESYSSVTLYFHFKPYAVTSDKFFLPTIINGILGPLLNKTDSKEVSRFLRRNIPYSRPIIVPSELAVVSVSSYAMEAKLMISKVNIHLNYAPFTSKYKSSYNLKLMNSQNEQESFCIRTDNVGPPLCLTQLSGPAVTYLAKSIVCTLEPHEEVVLKISFRPYRYGIYTAVLPIFLRSDYSERPHNRLFIKAKYEMPTIVCNHPIIYFKPLPLKIHTIGSKKFILKNHFHNCNVYCSCSLPLVELYVCGRLQVNRNTQELWLRTHYFSEDRISQVVLISVNCSCGGTCTVKAHLTVENCFLTNYALVHTLIMHPEYDLELPRSTSVDTLRRSSLISMMEDAKETCEEYNLNEFFKSYPFFPVISEATNEKEEIFVEFMERSVRIMESWMSTQAFRGTIYYKIPEGIGHVHVGAHEPNRKIANKLPFVQLLHNMLGDAVGSYLQYDITMKCADESLNHIIGLYYTYKKAIAFLIGLGARFTCIHPAYLLPFEMYTNYVKSLAPELDDGNFLIVEDATQFNRLSKQCWLDMILQTYKVLVLNKVIRPLEELPTGYEAPDTPHQRYRQTIKNIVKNNHLFNTTELLLLKWLEFHFNNAKNTFWPGNTNLSHRQISHFDEVLEDGYVYAAITLTFCPYLEDHFKKLSAQTLGQEDMLHNNIQVIQSWDILNLNIDVTVTDLTNSHPLKTLLIIVYLFEVLPYFYPSETLELKTGLSTQTEHVLTLTNTNDFEVAYKATLYGNDDDCFDIGKNFYVIAANSRCHIKVTYHAKFIKTANATLILSGENQGYRFTRSKVISLCGEPNVSYVIASYELSSEIYKVKEYAISVSSPYPVPATYRIQNINDVCNTAEDVEDKPFRDNLPQFCLSRCVSLNTSITCNKEGDAEVTLCVCMLTPVSISTWLYFRNEDIGDFAIKITTEASPLLRQEMIEVELPYNYKSSRDDEPIEAILEIPCQNRLMWRSIVDMLLKFAVTDIEFWKNILYTTAGMHVLRRLLWITVGPFADQMKMCEPSTFNIKHNKKCKVILPEFIHIEDRCSTKTVKLPFRITDSKYPESFSIALISEDELEMRQYRVYFVMSSISGMIASQTEGSYK